MRIDFEQGVAEPSASRPAADAGSIRLILMGEGPVYHETLAKLSKQGFPIQDFGAGVSLFQSSIAEPLADILKQLAKLSKPGDRRQSDNAVICGKLYLHPDTRRAYWNGTDLDLTFGEYKILHLLVSDRGHYKAYRVIYDCFHYEGFIAGVGPEGYKANVRSAIKRIRNKFRTLDPGFDRIVTYPGFGYCWKETA
jgi:hypothetical protein